MGDLLGVTITEEPYVCVGAVVRACAGARMHSWTHQVGSNRPQTQLFERRPQQSNVDIASRTSARLHNCICKDCFLIAFEARLRVLSVASSPAKTSCRETRKDRARVWRRPDHREPRHKRKSERQVFRICTILFGFKCLRSELLVPNLVSCVQQKAFRARGQGAHGLANHQSRNINHAKHLQYALSEHLRA